MILFFIIIPGFSSSWKASSTFLKGKISLPLSVSLWFCSMFSLSSSIYQNCILMSMLPAHIKWIGPFSLWKGIWFLNLPGRVVRLNSWFLIFFSFCLTPSLLEDLVVNRLWSSTVCQTTFKFKTEILVDMLPVYSSKPFEFEPYRG